MNNCKVIHNHYHHHHPVGTVVHKITDSVTEKRVQELIDVKVNQLELPVTEQRAQELIDQNTAKTQEMLSGFVKLINDFKTEFKQLDLAMEHKVKELIDQIELPDRQTSQPQLTQQQGVTEQRAQELIDQSISKSEKESEPLLQEAFNMLKNEISDCKVTTEQRMQELIDDKVNQKVLSIIEKMIAECKLKTEHEVREMVNALKFDKAKRTMHYVFNYKSFDELNISYSPTVLRIGHPTTLICATNFTSHTKLIILSHIFDQDKTHGDDLTLMYNLLAITKNGDVNTKPEPRLRLSNYRHGTKNYYTLNLALKISDFYDNVDNIAFLSVVIARTSDVSYGTESVIDVLVEY